MFLRKYNTATTLDGIPLITRGSQDLKANPTLAAGDVKISIDGGALANLATLPTVSPAAGPFVRIALSAGETTGAHIAIYFIDQTAPKEWEDQVIIIHTFGHASAQFQVDLSDSVAFGLSRLDATITSRSTYAGADTAGTTTLLARLASALTITGGKVDVNDKTGFSLSGAGAQAVWDILVAAQATAGSLGKLLKDDIDAAISSRSTYAGADTAGTTTLLARIAAAITITAGKVDVNDKTGFDLSAGARQSIWDILVASQITAGSLGKLIKDFLDAAITSRATPAQILATPAQLLQTDAAGAARVASSDLTTAATRVWAALVATNNDAGSFGAVMGQIPQLFVWRGDVIVGDSGSITLASTPTLPPQGERAGYGLTVYIYAGAGAGQARQIANYDSMGGTTRICTVDTNWFEIPDNTSKVILFPFYNSPITNTSIAIACAARVWDELAGNHLSVDSTGGFLNALINRLGLFTGAGENTVLGVLRAIARSDLAAPTDIGGTYNPALSSLQAFGNRFGLGSGNRFVTVTVLTDTDAPVSGVLLVVRNPDGTSVGDGYGRTNEDGQVVFSLNAGDYSLGITSSMVYALPAPVLFTVAGAPLRLAVTLIPQVVTPPVNPDACNVVCHVIKPDLSPKEGLVFTFTLQTVNISEVGTNTVVNIEQLSKPTDATGEMLQTIIQPQAIDAPALTTVRWRIQCTTLGIDVLLTNELNTGTFDLGAHVHP